MIDWEAVMTQDYWQALRWMRRKMPARLKGRFDPEDFVCAALVDAVTRPQYYQGPQTLIVMGHARMVDAIRSNKRKQEPFDVDTESSEPRPDQHHDANELLSLYRQRMNPPAAIDLRRAGYTVPEIAEKLGVGKRVMQRRFKAVTMESNQ